MSWRFHEAVLRDCFSPSWGPSFLSSRAKRLPANLAQATLYTQARAAGDVEAKCRYRYKAPMARRLHLYIATLTPLNCRAGVVAFGLFRRLDILE
jgi:hypothetical protein